MEFLLVGTVLAVTMAVTFAPTKPKTDRNPITRIGHDARARIDKASSDYLNTVKHNSRRH